jgi:hypothetical protein
MHAMRVSDRLHAAGREDSRFAAVSLSCSSARLWSVHRVVVVQGKAGWLGIAAERMRRRK